MFCLQFWVISTFKPSFESKKIFFFIITSSFEQPFKNLEKYTYNMYNTFPQKKKKEKKRKEKKRKETKRKEKKRKEKKRKKEKEKERKKKKKKERKRKKEKKERKYFSLPNISRLSNTLFITSCTTGAENFNLNAFFFLLLHI